MSHQVYTECSTPTTVDFALKGKFISDDEHEADELIIITGGSHLRLYRLEGDHGISFVCETVLPGRCHDAVVYRRSHTTVYPEYNDVNTPKQDQALLIFRDGQLSLLCYDPYSNAMRCTCSYSPLYGGVSHVTGVEDAMGADGTGGRAVSVVAETGHCLNDPQRCTVRSSASSSLCAITVSDRLGHLTLCTLGGTSMDIEGDDTQQSASGCSAQTIQIRRLLGLYAIDDMQFLDTPTTATEELPVLACVGPSFMKPHPSVSRMEHSSHNASMLSILAVDPSRIVSTSNIGGYGQGGVGLGGSSSATPCASPIWAIKRLPLNTFSIVPLGLGSTMLLLSPDVVVAVSGGFGSTWCQTMTEAASMKELEKTKLPVKQRNIPQEQLSMDGCAFTVWSKDVVIFALASSLAYVCHVIYGAGEQITDLIWQKVEVTLPLQAVHTLLSYHDKSLVISATTMGDVSTFKVQDMQLTLPPTTAQRMPALSCTSDSESTTAESPEGSNESVFEAVQEESKDDPLLGKLMEIYACDKVSSEVVPSVKCLPLNPHLLPSLGVVRHAAPLPNTEDLPSDLLVLSCGMATTGKLAVVHRECQVPVEEVFTCSVSSSIDLDTLRSSSLWTIDDGSNEYGVLSLGTQEGSVLLDLTSSISEVFRTPESALDVGKMADCYYMVTPLGVRRLPVGSSTAEMVLHFGLPCKQASINEEFVAAVMDDGTLGLFRHIDGAFKDIPTDKFGVPEGSDSPTPPLWASAHVSGGKMAAYLTLVEQETSAVKIYDISSTPPVLVFDVACIAVAPPLIHPRPKTTNLFLSITDPTSRPIAPPAAPPPIDASSVIAAVQLHWLGDLPLLVVMIRNRPPLIYRSFPCPGRPLQESFPYSFQMVEHKNCGLVAEMNSSTEDTPVWTSSAMVTRFEKLGSYEEEGLLLIPSARAPPLVVVKSSSEEIFVHPVGPTGTVSAASLNAKYNPDGLITVQLSSNADDMEKVDVDLVLYQFSSFQAPAGEGEEASSFQKDKGVNGVVIDGPAMAVDDHDVLMGDVDGVLNGDDNQDEESSKKASAVEDRSTLESGIIHFDIARPIPCALIPASGQQETPHLCAGGTSAVAVVATRQEWDHQEASGLPEHILELSQEFAAQSGLSTGDFSIEDMIAPTAMAKDECPVVRMRDRYQLRVVSRADMRTVLAQYRMKPDEIILDATFMSDMEGLPDPTSVIAIGSAIQGGEDRSARGGLTLLRITALASKATSSVVAAEEGENALDEEEPDADGGGPGDIDKSGCSILIHLDKRGPVTSVRPWRQHLIISIGFRVFMYKWNAKKDTLEGIAMLDTMGPSITSLCTVKNYILAGDAIRGLQFARFKHNKQQHTNSISYLAKTHYSQTLPVVAVATSVRDSNLGLIALDAHGNIHVSSFSPHFDPIRGTGGDVLLHGRPFFMSSISTCMIPSPVDMGTVLMPLSDGSIGRLLAVNPSDFTVLSRLFTHLVTMLPSPGALHPGVQREPVAYRQSQALPDEPSPVVDGEVCRKFLFLNRWIQAEIAHQIGVEDLDELCRAVAMWTKVSDRS